MTINRETELTAYHEMLKKAVEMFFEAQEKIEAAFDQANEALEGYGRYDLVRRYDNLAHEFAKRIYMKVGLQLPEDFMSPEAHDHLKNVDISPTKLFEDFLYDECISLQAAADRRRRLAKVANADHLVREEAADFAYEAVCAADLRPIDDDWRVLVDQAWVAAYDAYTTAWEEKVGSPLNMRDFYMEVQNAALAAATAAVSMAASGPTPAHASDAA